MYTKPKFLTGNKIWRARSRYGEFFLRPRIRVSRYIVIRLHANVIEATISCGPYKGEAILLPRIPLIPSDSELPFQFRRLQFPCKPGFSRPDIQDHWSGPLCPMFHPWPAICGCLSGLQHIQTKSIRTTQSDTQCAT